MINYAFFLVFMIVEKKQHSSAIEPHHYDMASPQPPAAEAVSLNTPDTPEDISRKRKGSPLTSTKASVIPSADTVVLPPTKIPRIEESHEQHGTTVASTTPTKQKKERKKKTRAALLFGYLGEGFAGLQINEGVRTVEGVLEPAIHRAGYMFMLFCLSMTVVEFLMITLVHFSKLNGLAVQGLTKVFQLLVTL